MDIEKLIAVYEEGKKGGLQKLEPEFYDEVRDFINNLEKEKENSENELEAMKIEDRIRTARRLMKKIFEGRISKITNLALARAFGTEVELRYLTPSEEELLRNMIGIIEKARRHILEGEKDSGEVEDLDEEEASDEDRVLVRIVEDVEEILGSDGKTYKLNCEDVITLPRVNAEALVKRGVAEIIEVGDRK